MAKVSENTIRTLDERWDYDDRTHLPYSGNAVQDFIVSYLRMAASAESRKFGAFYPDPADNTFYFFKSDTEKNEWLRTGDNSLVLTKESWQPTGVINLVSVDNKMSSDSIYFTTNSETAEIEFGFISQEKEITSTEWRNFNEDAYVSVSVDKGAKGSWEEILSNELLLNGNTKKVDVRNYLATGANRVLVTVVGSLSNKTGTLSYNVNLTSMYLSPSNFAWYMPFIEGSTYNLGGVNIGGAIPKKLIVKVTNENGYEKRYEENIGTQVYTTNAYFFRGLQFPSMGTGVYSVEMWLDADGLQSEHLVYSLICVSKADEFTAQLVAISSYPQKVVNYADNTLFKYAVYNGGRTTASPVVSVTAIVNTSPILIKNETLNNINTSTELTYNMHLEVETEESDLSLRASLTFGNEQVRNYLIDNSASYPSTRGATFYLNASNRNNAQSNKLNVINEANKTAIPTVWEYMSWSDSIDGWTEDEKGRKCLVVPARSKANIAYKPFSNLTNGKVVEINFKVDNIADFNESVISICDNPDREDFRGIKITPSSIILHSRDLNTDDELQSYDYQEGEFVNLLIAITYNYKVNYGNFAQIYVNGVKKCSFAFQTTDSWIHDGNIILGCQNSDLFLYSMRVYDLSFGFLDAQKNYIASLDNSKAKADESSKINSILDDSGVPQYDLIKGRYNTMVVEMLNNAELPRNGLSKEYSAFCNFDMEYADEPNLNFRMENVQISGQGTTSMNYYRWNLRFRLDKSKSAKIGYAGETPVAGTTVKFHGTTYPAVQRITAKKNYASSMQSHKMGATAAYNDIQKEIGIHNEVDGRTAVYQYPVIGFQKTLIDGTTDRYTYQFIGLFTIGADKGDKATFGYKDANYKDTLIHLEGTDHSVKGVGFDYPWSQLKYVLDKESICVDRGNGEYEAAWEVSSSGDTEDEIQALLNAEFKPAYEHIYNNSPVIMGTSTPIEEINANVEQWGLLTDREGHSYQRYEFWIDGEYELYYLNRKTNQYEKNGINLLTQLGISESQLSGLAVNEKNKLFKDKRIERFVNGLGNYFDVDDTLYCIAFLIIFGATDNFKKNFYPYKFGTLASGSRWRFRQDDLDTLFDIDNQGLSNKPYSIEPTDWTNHLKSAYMFKGEDSALVQGVLQGMNVQLNAMGKRILGGMYNLSDEGSVTTDRIMGFFNKYFWNKAQNYFPKSAYNLDAEYSYEDAYPFFGTPQYSTSDVSPLAQELGDHFEAERAWVKNRMLYCMSKFKYGSYGSSSDSSLTKVSIRTQVAQSFTLTPARDMYPTILGGQSLSVSSPYRVKAGEECTLSNVGGGNTNVYIINIDDMSSIGDLKDLNVDIGTGISISSKRLKEIKIGDADASLVTTNLSSLTVGECPSLLLVDCRNAPFAGSVDLSHCPRLKEAYFDNSNVRSVTLANGSKVTKLSLSESINQLQLLNLKFLEMQGFTSGSCANVELLRVENCPQLDIFTIIKNLYSRQTPLKYIRFIGFEHNGNASDLDMLSNMAQNLSVEGTNHPYGGISVDGVPSQDMKPIIEGTLNIDGDIYRDSYDFVRSNYPNLSMNVNGGYYIRFADEAVLALCANKWGSGTGLTETQAANVAVIGASPFAWKTTIVSFNELSNFTGLTRLSNDDDSNTANSAFIGCTALEEISLPQSLNIIGANTFNGCSKLRMVNGGSGVTKIRGGAFNSCSKLEIDVNFPNLTLIGSQAFRNSKVRSIVSLGNITTIPSYAFGGCTSLQSINLPSSLITVGANAFNGCSGLTGVLDLRGTNITTLGENAFYCSGLTDIYLPQSLTSLEPQRRYAKWKYSPDGVINLPNLEVLKNYVFQESSIVRVENLGRITYVGSTSTSTSSHCYTFYGSPVEFVRLPSTVTIIASRAFCSVRQLRTLIVEATTPPTLVGTDQFTTTHANFKIYVPDASVEAYKAATNWSAVASKIYPLSSYTE